jgi:uncharacterized membrane protein YfcA
MDLTWIHFLILVVSGLLVGFINTLAGGGSIISLSVFMLFGLDPVTANGTNRIAVLMQNSTAVINFGRKKMIDWSKSFQLTFSIIPGTIIGTLFANIITNSYFNLVFGIAIILFTVMLIVKPDRWLREKESIVNNPLRFWHYFLFFLIGIYAGFIHVGVGYFILFMLIFGTGNELVKANAIKNFLVLATIPFSLAIFAIQGNINWTYGLIHSIGNIIGAQIGSMVAIKRGAGFIRWIMIILTFFIVLQLFGIIDSLSILECFKE